MSAMRANSNANAVKAVPGKDAPCLDYQMYLFTLTNSVKVICIFAPTLNFMPDRSLQYAISFDDDEPQIITLVSADFNATHGNVDWEKTVADNARFSESLHSIKKSGYHTLKIWMVDQGVVLQKLIVDLGGLKQSYMGAPESYFNPFD